MLGFNAAPLVTDQIKQVFQNVAQQFDKYTHFQSLTQSKGVRRISPGLFEFQYFEKWRKSIGLGEAFDYFRETSWR